MIVVLVVMLFLILYLKKCIITRNIFKNIQNVTVVICNYDRPYNVETIINKLKTYPYINQIVIVHGKKDTFKKFEGCVNLYNENTHKYGAAERFFSVQHIKNNWTLFIDDDHLPSVSLIKSLCENMAYDEMNIYGPFPRSCTNYGYFYFYFLNYNTILTPILMTNKKIITSYLENFDKYKDSLIKHKGNGEDLSFNHHFRNYYNKHPVFVYGSYELLPEGDGFTYSKQQNHWSIRSNICKHI